MYNQILNRSCVSYSGNQII